MSAAAQSPIDPIEVLTQFTDLARHYTPGASRAAGAATLALTVAGYMLNRDRLIAGLIDHYSGLPELLAAARQARDLINHPAGYSYEQEHAIFNALEAAIAKAEGQQS